MVSEETKRIAEGFHCRYTVFEKGTDPALVEQAYRAASEAGRKDGFWPAIISLNEYILRDADALLTDDGEKEKLIAGCQDNGKEILAERFAEGTEDDDEDALRDLIGEETEGEVIDSFSGFCSFADGMLEADTLLLEIPVKNPWEIIAYLPLGGWNECPDPEDMMAICRYWYEKYQAVPAAFTSDVMEFYAPKGLNGVDSIEAAKEHYAFCTDRIYQGTTTSTISELAAGLEDSSVWYFWWD